MATVKARVSVKPFECILEVDGTEKDSAIEYIYEHMEELDLSSDLVDRVQIDILSGEYDEPEEDEDEEDEDEE